jgi:hypothetical protein
MDNNLQNNTVVQPSANPSTGVSATDPARDITPSVTDLGVNEAVNIASFPSNVGGGQDASMTIAQPAGGPIVTGEAGPN